MYIPKQPRGKNLACLENELEIFGYVGFPHKNGERGLDFVSFGLYWADILKIGGSNFSRN